MDETIKVVSSANESERTEKIAKAFETILEVFMNIHALFYDIWYRYFMHPSHLVFR